MKIDVEDVLCKAEAISLQMVKCKVYSILSNEKIFWSMILVDWGHKIFLFKRN